MVRNTMMLSASALLALSFVAGPVATGTAVAQEAIMLETVGAVRMLSPDELQRRDAEALRQQQQTQQARPVALSQQHADLAQ